MSQLPPVTIVCPNVSGNALGRALLLAELLGTETKVQIAGLRQAASIWPPASSSQVPIVAYPGKEGRLHYFDGVSWLREVAADDFVLISKPVLQSLGLALLGRIGKRGMIVDIDDWQSGFFQYDRISEHVGPLRQRIARLRSYARRGGLNGFVLTRLLEEYSRRRPHTVSNRFLQGEFGGELLYHVRDPAVLDPQLPPSTSLERLPSDRLWVGFVGTPRLHKGIRELIDAVKIASRDVALGLAIMGVSNETEAEVEHARATLPKESLRLIAPFPIRELRDHIALTDILAIPSRKVPGSWGQIPAKLFDAMSMAKPIVATKVNDIPEILDGVGICVEPGDSGALAASLVTLARDPARRERLGRLARERLIERYSYAAGRRVLIDVVRQEMVRK